MLYDMAVMVPMMLRCGITGKLSYRGDNYSLRNEIVQWLRVTQVAELLSVAAGTTTTGDGCAVG